MMSTGISHCAILYASHNAAVLFKRRRPNQRSSFVKRDINVADNEMFNGPFESLTQDPYLVFTSCITSIRLAVLKSLMLRDKVRNDITHILANTSNGKAINIEKSIYNFTIDEAKRLAIEPSWEEVSFSHIYKQKYMDIRVNLLCGPLSNMINENVVSTKQIARLTPQELNPDKWKPEIDIIDTKDVVEGIFQCKKCKSKRTTYYSLQTRSSDEPMTNFITCVDCSNRWKM